MCLCVFSFLLRIYAYFSQNVLYDIYILKCNYAFSYHL